MIDFHCHLDLYPDPAGVLAEAVRRGCYVLAVTTTPLALDGTKRLIGDAPRVRIGLGLHPELVATRAHEVQRFSELVASAHFVGEVGLDGSPPHRSSLPLQQEVFRAILKSTAAQGGRVMSIHSRGAVGVMLAELGTHAGKTLPVLHWFSGTPKELESAIELGCWFSVGPAMLKTEKGRALARRMPSERVLTESDGPFARNGNVPLYPWDVADATAALGILWGTSAVDARERIRQNLRSLLKLRGSDSFGGLP